MSLVAKYTLHVFHFSMSNTHPDIERQNKIFC